MAHNHQGTAGESPTVQHEEAVHQQSLEHVHAPQLGPAPPQITAALTGDDELLRKIIKNVPFTDRHENCPLVCKKWSKITTGASEIWEEVVLDLQEHLAVQKNRPLRWASVLRWIAARAASIRSLKVKNFTEALHWMQDVQEGAIAGVLTSVSQNVERLAIQDSPAVFKATDIIYMGCFGRLQSLQIDSLLRPVTSAQLENLGNLTALKNLELSFQADGMQQNVFGGFPQRLTQLTRLTRLEFNMAGPHAFERLPEGISNLKKLVDLQLYRCGVRALPKTIGAMESLETLLVEGFSIQGSGGVELPKSLTQCQSLRRLILTGMDYMQVPEVVQSLDTLTELDMSFNPLQGVPSEALAHWANMETLKLVGCQLTAVPETVQHMSQLRHLDLSANQQLSRLDGGSYLEHLRELNLSRCEFERVPPVLGGAKELRQLDLSFNFTLEVDADGVEAIKKLSSLQNLNMMKDGLLRTTVHYNGQTIVPIAWTEVSMHYMLVLVRDLARLPREHVLTLRLCNYGDLEFEV